MTWTFYNAQGQEKRASVSAPSSVPIENWHVVGAAGEPPFFAGVSAYGGGYAPPAFRKLPDGTVELSGLLSSAVTTRPLTLFTLPAGYRPVLAAGFSAHALYAQDASGVFAAIRVGVGGDVNLWVGSTGFVSIEGIRFSTGQTTWPTGPMGPYGAPTLVSVLPTSPADGDEIYFQTAAMGVDGIAWHLRYNAASGSAYKWECVGPADLHAFANASENFTGTAPADFAGGPSLTLPLAGDYLASWGGNAGHSGSNQSARLLVAATGFAYDINFSASYLQPAGTNSGFSAVSRIHRVNGISGTLKMGYSQGLAGGSAYNRWLAARPLRVG